MTTNGMNPQLATVEPDRPAPLPGARMALILLLAINAFNYIDRQVLAAVEPNISHELLRGDPDAKEKTGDLSMAFLVSYMILSPLFGWLGDRFSRWRLIAVGVILWSLASGASGYPWPVVLTHAYLVLLVTRCFVGVGEAAYGPVAPTVISDLYPVKVRGKVLAWFYLAIPVGSALGYTLGGQVASPASYELTALSWQPIREEKVPEEVIVRLKGLEGRDFPNRQDLVGEIETRLSAEELEHYRTAIVYHAGKPALGWRWAFYVVVPPGIILGLLCLFMREPPRGQADAGVTTRPVVLADYKVLLRTPSYVLDTLGMTAMTFAMGALGFFMPAYLQERDAPSLGPLEPTTAFGVLITLAGLIATLTGGMLGDRLRPRYPGSYFLVSGVAMLLGFPMVALVLVAPFPYAWVFLFLAVFLLFFNTGPTNTILANVTHPSIRASAFAINIFVIHLLGDAFSPKLIGRIASVYGPKAGKSELYGLTIGFWVVSVAVLIGGFFWLWGVRYLERDTQLAPTRFEPAEPSV
jgi:MFS family permease